jgi:hypothetical protein
LSQSTGAKRALEVVPPHGGEDAFLSAEGLTFDNGVDRTHQSTAPAIDDLPPDAAGADQFYQEVLRATRMCIQYGIGGFAVVCIVIGAVEALFRH